MNTSTDTNPTRPTALLTQADVSAQCALSKSFLYALIARRAFPAPSVRLGPRFTRWASTDVEAWKADPHGWKARAEKLGAKA